MQKRQPAVTEVHAGLDFPDAVTVVNAAGSAGIVLVCEHASCRVPARYAGLGLAEAELQRHIGWDIGALDLALECSRLLDAPLVHAGYSRLLLDVNRPPDAPDSIVEHSEDTVIPGNLQLSEPERLAREQGLYAPFHAALAGVIEARRPAAPGLAVVNIHSFTPVYRGVPRPWLVGILSDRDRRLADGMLQSLRREEGLCCGDNEPYSPRDRVYHTLDRHAQTQGLPSVMIEVRNDQLLTAEGRAAWAARLCSALGNALGSLPNGWKKRT